MSTLEDLLGEHTALGPEPAEHLQRLVGEWQLLADLSFADLLVWVPTFDGGLLCVAQVRPTTTTTVHQDDLVGEYAAGPGTQVLWKAVDADPDPGGGADNAILAEPDTDWRGGDIPLRREAIPVVHAGSERRVVGVLSRDTNLANLRSRSALERTYLATAGDLLRMIAAGTFPAVTREPDPLTGPRVGDGLLRLDARGRVMYASPNAHSAYRRMGLTTDLAERELAALTRSLANDPFDGVEVANRINAALAGGSPPRVEAEGRGATVRFRALPLRAPNAEPGVLVLVRDVTDLRRRDRQLLSKDATIREIHHRVKNNLQTVAALLRLQARRMSTPAARHALEESVRRVSSIAMVHETLSLSMDESVEFDGIVDRLVPMVAELAATECRIRIRREGSFGVLSAELATPLVMVLTELLQNAVEHAFPPSRAGEVIVHPKRESRRMIVTVSDNGAGLPRGFSLEASERLGLQIVRTLVESELRGTITVRNRVGGGTSALIDVPLPRRLPA